MNGYPYIYIYQWVYQPTNQQISYKLQYYTILPYYIPYDAKGSRHCLEQDEWRHINRYMIPSSLISFRGT